MTQRLVERPRATGPVSGAPKTAPVPAVGLPVARVAVDVPLPHLDRLFDYLVPESMAETAVPGCRVKVRFAGRQTAGFVVERAETSDHQGPLAFLHRVVSSEPVLTPELTALARAVADRYGGTLADVLRLAIPPRHAAAEAAKPPVSAKPAAVAADHSWAEYPAGPSYLAALAAGRSPRAVWAALPGQGWPEQLAQAARAVLASARGALIIVPDAGDLELLEVAMAGAIGGGAFVSLSAQLGPAERYRRWLRVLRGQVTVAIGTRSAMFAPVADLGLVAIWDDGDDSHEELHAPYPHARDVLLLRAHAGGAAALIGGFAQTAETAQLLANGWARPLRADRQTVRAHAPAIRTAGDDAELARDEAAQTARLPSLALRTAREGLATGPVLVQVPRRGYLAAVACKHCGTRIRCASCAGPVALSGPGQPLQCGWCGMSADQNCPACGGVGLRALVTGTRRTAEELGRAFPGYPVCTSSGAEVVRVVSADAAIVIATPGAEPQAPAGYSAAILLDGWALLGRPSLRSAEEALRRWMNAAALVKPGPAGGRVVVMADPSVPAVQALVRWDAAAHADRELSERAELRFPPSVRMAALTGLVKPIEDLLASVTLPAGAEVLGPVEAPDRDRERDSESVRFLVRAPAPAGTQLALALRSGLAERSAHKEPGNVRVQLDPAELI